MSSGILYTGIPANATATTAYTVPSTTYTVCNVSFTNTGTASATVRLYMGTSTGASPVASEAIEYDTVVAPKGVFERTGLVLSSTTSAKNIVVYATPATINVNIYGIETSTV
jgi:hypothetical protein